MIIYRAIGTVRRLICKKEKNKNIFYKSVDLFFYIWYYNCTVRNKTRSNGKGKFI